MKELLFLCTLKTDVILNEKSASMGNNKTLDFIPGNCFLGMVAAKVYDKNGKTDNPQEAFELLYSGNVRYGDAHPADGTQRALKIPASFFYAKGDEISDAAYVHHHITDAKKIVAKSGAMAQLKQSREGFYVFDGGKAQQVAVSRNFAIKSAYDRQQRRSKDSAMYGYESLQAGLQMMFAVEVDNEANADFVVQSLEGIRRVGRSRTAQYGLVQIKYIGEGKPKAPVTAKGKVTVYADGRLIFIDEATGQPTFRPTAKQLGIDGGRVLWNESQVRTFQYAPWNFKRKSFDADRCGIEKGSVFVVECDAEATLAGNFVGQFRNEGFGKVIYNAGFLEAEENSNGKAKCTFAETKGKEDEEPKIQQPITQLVSYILKRQKAEQTSNNVYKAVNNEEAAFTKLFKGKEAFASQWGTIRSIALQEHDNKKIKEKVLEYVQHGVKAEDWEEGNRVEKLRKFMEQNNDTLWESIINLASQMAKICKKK